MNRNLRMLDGRYRGTHLGSRVQYLDPSGMYVGPAGGKGKCWFVDSTATSLGDGTAWDRPFLTITDAYAAAAAGDTIYISGSFLTEAAITCSKAGLSFVGVGNAQKQAQWSSATDTMTLTIAAAYVRVENIYFKPPTYTAGIPASIALSGANYAQIIGNRFQGQTASWNAIYSAVCNSDNVTIAGNEFMYLNTATYGCAILGVEAGGLSYSGWKIVGNTFESCVKAVNINGRVCLIEGNHFATSGINAAGAGAAVAGAGYLDLSGTSSYGNLVHGNYLGGTYNATLYVAGAAGDDWAGNYNIAGITAANPA